MQQLLPFALHQAADGNARPLGDDVGNFVLRHRVVDHGVVSGVLFGKGLGLFQLFFQCGQVGVFQLGGLLVFQTGLGLLNLALELLQLAFQLLDLVHAVLFRLPAGFQGVELLLFVG